jgi:hypothetical protein
VVVLAGLLTGLVGSVGVGLARNGPVPADTGPGPVVLPARLDAFGFGCSGWPLSGTNIVVTAAHCVDGPVTHVHYGGQTYNITGQQGHPRYVSVEGDEPNVTPGWDVGYVTVDGTFADDGFAARLARPSEIDLGRNDVVEYFGWSTQQMTERTSGQRTVPSLYACQSTVSDDPNRNGDGDEHRFTLDCDAQKGNSGSGVVRFTNNKPVLVGVLNSVGDETATCAYVSALVDILPDDITRAAGWS